MEFFKSPLTYPHVTQTGTKVKKAALLDLFTPGNTDLRQDLECSYVKLSNNFLKK